MPRALLSESVFTLLVRPSAASMTSRRSRSNAAACSSVGSAGSSSSEAVSCPLASLQLKCATSGKRPALRVWLAERRREAAARAGREPGLLARRKSHRTRRRRVFRLPAEKHRTRCRRRDIDVDHLAVVVHAEARRDLARLPPKVDLEELLERLAERISSESLPGLVAGEPDEEDHRQYRKEHDLEGAPRSAVGVLDVRGRRHVRRGTPARRRLEVVRRLGREGAHAAALRLRLAITASDDDLGALHVKGGHRSGCTRGAWHDDTVSRTVRRVSILLGRCFLGGRG